MSYRQQLFIRTFFITGLFVFTFYYFSSDLLVDAILLGIIGGLVIGLIVSMLIPFIQNRKN